MFFCSPRTVLVNPYNWEHFCSLHPQASSDSFLTSIDIELIHNRYFLTGYFLLLIDNKLLWRVQKKYKKWYISVWRSQLLIWGKNSACKLLLHNRWNHLKLAIYILKSKCCEQYREDIWRVGKDFLEMIVLELGPEGWCRRMWGAFQLGKSHCTGTCEHKELVNFGQMVIGFNSLDALPVPTKHDVLGQIPSIPKA